MDQFPNKEHVWVRSRALRTYLHASTDGTRVSLLPTRASINAAWAVQVHEAEHGSPCVLLQGAAYGRYLAATDLPAPFGHSGYRASQLEYCDIPVPEEESVLWRVIPAASGDDVLLRHSAGGRYLRANGNGRRNTGVTVEKIRSLTTMAQWEVEVIPANPNFPGIPGPIYEPVRRDRRILSTGRELPPLRLIRFVQADAEGEYNEDGWSQFSFRGNSIYQLRNEVANRVHINSFVMCVRAGLHAPLAPMLANLPSGRTGNTLYIVVIQSTTPAELAPRYPDINA
ncbi:uncharacterized protein LOC112270552 [Brachypodium distachyon]|uniref:Uncharacterized protein n=1 Tax=Brachypodium distachyon TaxID=15368 RepID=A0A0Q3JP61_BRADI|nr:uncharacterized protein LOC112270552 [Brachypodium distachyon]KQK19539.1 hypothetical protein BRADI_1g48910v3 [Brachypodium distachyon]|eukprot:XP_024313977.1 uncharacterized protein LOC112270552 [Brachypodium distachyon]